MNLEELRQNLIRTIGTCKYFHNPGKNVEKLVDVILSIEIGGEVEEGKDIQCPVCGYYCLGKGGHGCIDKTKLYKVRPRLLRDCVKEER